MSKKDSKTTESTNPEKELPTSHQQSNAADSTSPATQNSSNSFARTPSGSPNSRPKRTLNELCSTDSSISAFKQASSESTSAKEPAEQRDTEFDDFDLEEEELGVQSLQNLTISAEQRKK
jgi:hypothetical protein